MEDIMDNKIYNEKMEKTIEALSSDLATIRAGRANANILNKIMVDYYGSPTPITQVAGVSVPEPRMIMIQPWEASILKDIEKAIQTSDIGLTPNNDGKVIRLNFPELTEERRKDLAKDVKKRGEDAKISIRNIRREAMDFYKKEEKASNISKDELADAEDSIQKLTDKFVAKIDELVEVKSKEIMTV